MESPVAGSPPRLDVTTPVFEGPLELLLALVEREEVDIFKVSLARVTDEIPKLRFNRCVAHVYELSNSLQASLTAAKQGRGIGPAYAAAVGEAAEIMVLLFSPMMPHLAEECWAALGQKTLIAKAPWPEVEQSLLVEDTITLPVQINGKKRADVTVARDARNTDIERAVLELEAVVRALEGKAPKKVIVVPQRIVNVVA